ncbi:hypothetical protein BKA65DRAFT_198567 [Rhexocercosporidium sp. MPI-PUGE-AT-0058]|nr:hypothetical protein BKA65DRAFT_198567 [Rhexocercosporidium sp. MPI-PUGE-AT-0058]
MTLIPADAKDSKHGSDQYPDPVARETTNPFPNPILPNASLQDQNAHFSPPPYSETDSNSHTLPLAENNTQPSYSGPSPSIPDVATALTSTPQSNAVSASSSVNLTGPLHITGSVKSSSSITLKNHIRVDGKVDSSSYIWLEGEIFVDGKVDSSSKVTLRDGVRVEGKVNASGAVELSNGIHVSDKVDASGAISLAGGARGIFIGGKLSSSGSIDITGRVEVLGPIKASGSLRIRSGEGKAVMKLGTKVEASSVAMEGDVEASGNLYISRTLKLKGNLHVSGDLEIKGDLIMRKGDVVSVAGKKTIHGSIKEV